MLSISLQGVLNGCLHFVQSTLAQPCLLCGARVSGHLLCPKCHADLPRLPDSRCPQCALPSPNSQICGTCLKKPPEFERTTAAYRYAFPLDALMHHYKYVGDQALADLFAADLAAALTNTLAGRPLPDLIVPMPLHPARLRERGFNQALEIARRLGRRLDLPCQLACTRLRDTSPQAGLDLKARKRNLRGAFSCTSDIQGKRIALLDDVMTSGSSLNELASVARAAGAASVEVWAAARTLPHASAA